MNKILTSEEFLKQNLPSSVAWSSFTHEKVKDIMIDFAKLHVKQALEAAAEKVTLNTYKKSQYSKKARWKKTNDKEIDLFSYEVMYKPSKSSILNAYPENLIQ